MVVIKLSNEGVEWFAIVEVDGKPAKACKGSREWCEEQAKRWAEQYGAEVVRE